MYAFAGPLLGLQDLGACNMYSNLRLHGGSNHLLVPTGLLGTLWPRVADAFAVVRIENSTSSWINSIYPGELTASIAPDEVELLRSVGQSGRMFNGAKARILGPHLAPPHVFHSRSRRAGRAQVQAK